MGKQYDQITEPLQPFIEQQQVYFVATTAPGSHINLSPKGLDSLRILNPNRVVWLNLTGSGNETAAHLLEDPRMTLMFCAFDGEPMILRLYGSATAVHPRDIEWPSLYSQFEPTPGARQIFDMTVELVQTSCGMGVPLFDYVEQREQLPAWAEKKGKDGIRQYWADRNHLSLDGRPTNIFGSSKSD